MLENDMNNCCRNAVVDRHHYSNDGYCVVIRITDTLTTGDVSLELVLQCPDESSAKQWQDVRSAPM